MAVISHTPQWLSYHFWRLRRSRPSWWQYPSLLTASTAHSVLKYVLAAYKHALVSYSRYYCRCWGALHSVRLFTPLQRPRTGLDSCKCMQGCCDPSTFPLWLCLVWTSSLQCTSLRNKGRCPSRLHSDYWDSLVVRRVWMCHTNQYM